MCVCDLGGGGGGGGMLHDEWATWNGNTKFVLHMLQIRFFFKAVFSDDQLSSNVITNGDWTPLLTRINFNPSMDK